MKDCEILIMVLEHCRRGAEDNSDVDSTEQHGSTAILYLPTSG